MPQPKIINLYNATFEIKFWERANIYSVLIPQSEKANDTLEITQNTISASTVSRLPTEDKARCPSSLQIRNGKNINNVELNSYSKYTSMTD